MHMQSVKVVKLCTGKKTQVLKLTIFYRLSQWLCSLASLPENMFNFVFSGQTDLIITG
jgi:hypothetical protein